MPWLRSPRCLRTSQASWRIDSLVLRYIDAKVLDYRTEDVFAFWKNKHFTTISPPNSLSHRKPRIVDSSASLHGRLHSGCSNPTGSVVVGFATAFVRMTTLARLKRRSDRPSKTHSAMLNTPFGVGLRRRNDITHDRFFKLIEGELEREFDDE